VKPTGIAVLGSGQGHTHSGSVFSEASFRIAVLGSATGSELQFTVFLVHPASNSSGRVF
jgi:hypothetical protein